MSDKPEDWKNYEDFAAGIDTNRLPTTDALVGQSLELSFPDHTLTLDFKSTDQLHWSDRGDNGTDTYEAIEVAPDTYFIDLTFTTKPREALTLIVNCANRHVLSTLCVAGEIKVEGKPLVEQHFEVGVLDSAGGTLSGSAPAPTRDLLGLRTWQRYSPHHLYEHTYLNSERYAWQCLVGEQRGHGDVDLASYYKFSEDQYLFTFREFIIPVASVFFFNMKAMRSTGKFLGLTGDGAIENNKAGSFIRIASKAEYEAGEEPV